MWLLYSDMCKAKCIPAVKQGKYRHIFCENFNLSFDKPKKDQCSLCNKYLRHKNSDSLTDELKMEYEENQKRKVVARNKKKKAKQKAKQKMIVLQHLTCKLSVLTTNCSLVSEWYYLRKWCCYNLTIFQLADKHAVCHIWDETHGKRGSCEIATCLLKNSQSVCSSGNVDEITYFSDTYVGQNKNQFVAASYMYSITKISQLKAINHKFLQSGRSQMECDSVHSAIEQSKKQTSNLNLQTTITWIKINWLKVRWIRVELEHPKTLFVNYTFDVEKFMKITTQRTTTRTKGRAKALLVDDLVMDICYTSRLPVSTKKIKIGLIFVKRG